MRFPRCTPTAAAVLVYAGITAVLFRDLLPDVTTHLYSDPGDPLLVTAILAWNATHVPLTAAWWNFPSFAPAEGVTAFTEHLLVTYPLASPIIWLTDNPVLAYNLIFLLAKPLNGLAAFALARHLTGSWAAGLVGGLAFAFAPYQAVHLGHVQLMLSFGMPFTLLWLHRYLDRGAIGAAVLVGAGWLLTALSNGYVLIFFPVLGVLWCLWFVRPSEWRRLVAPAISVGVASLVVAPLLWGYRVRLAAYGFERELGEIRAFSADVASLFAMFHANLAWRDILPHIAEERALFPGFTILALAAAGVWSTRRAARSGVPARAGTRRLFAASGAITAIVLWRVWTGPWGWRFGPIPLPPFAPHRLFSIALLLGVVATASTTWFRRAWRDRDPVVFYLTALVVLWLLALGPLPELRTPSRFIAYGPYWALMHVPLLNTVRVPARVWLVGILCLAVLAAYGTAALLRRFGRRPAPIVATLALLIGIEGAFAALTVEVPAPTLPGLVPRGALVLDLPAVAGYPNAVPQYRAVVGGYRTINGYSGYEPPAFSALLTALSEMRDEAFDDYRQVEDVYVVVRHGTDPALERWIARLPGAERGPAAGDVRVYRLPGRAP